MKKILLFVKISDKKEEFSRLENIAEKTGVRYRIFINGEGFSEAGFFIQNEGNEEFFKEWDNEA